MIGTSAPPTPRTKVLFLSDLDGTWLSKNPEKRAALDRGVVELKDEYRRQGIDLQFGYVTARPPQRVVSENLPKPDWTITDNGGFIHQGSPCDVAADGTLTVAPQVPEWQAINEASGFISEQTVARARQLAEEPEFRNLSLHTVGQVVGHPEADACPWLAALCFDDSSVKLTDKERVDANGNGTPDLFESASFDAPQQIERFQDRLEEELQADGVQYSTSPIYGFAGKPIVMFDVSSPMADKGHAVEYLMQREGVTPQHVIVAGDGGNDIAMMRRRDGVDDGRRAIVVGGGSDLVSEASDLQRAIIQPSDMDCSEGVLDGLRKHLDQILADLQKS